MRSKVMEVVEGQKDDNSIPRSGPSCRPVGVGGQRYNQFYNESLRGELFRG